MSGTLDGAPTGTTSAADAQVRIETAEQVVSHEWAQFQRVNGEDGRAVCQDDWCTFRQMRLAQFLTWPLPLLRSWAGDLADADSRGRNLITEKYARMMASTEPERYQRELAPSLPELTSARIAQQEEVVAIQVVWAEEFIARYPHLGEGMRVLRTSQDTLTDTSFETYLRGELGTYSGRTSALYRAFVLHLQRQGANLTAQTLRWTVLLGGFTGLAEAEAAQAAAATAAAAAQAGAAAAQAG